MLRLVLRTNDPIPLEAPCVRPDTLMKLSLPEIERLSITLGNRLLPLGECFMVSGDPADGMIRIEGDCTRVKHLGSGMTSGRLIIDGNAGWHLGVGMSGGSIEVGGNTGDWAGAEMGGGQIVIRGNAGHCVGAAYRGGRHGMTGGSILVHGNVGHELGATLRRGLIAVAGSTGDFAGVSMIAGTLVLFGPVGQRAGAGLKRGSIVAFGPITLPPTFAYDCELESVFVSLYLRQLRQWGFPIGKAANSNLFDRYSGDRLTIGKGEVLVCRERF